MNEDDIVFRERPDTITITIKPDAIEVDNNKPKSSNRQKVWGWCDKQITFQIENQSGEDQIVKIPPVEIVPSGDYGGDATPFPLASGQCVVSVPKGGKGEMKVTVKPVIHFRWSRPVQGMTYKYTIYSNKHFLDPDLEINP